jgi:hypothetical protein
VIVCPAWIVAGPLLVIARSASSVSVVEDEALLFAGFVSVVSVVTLAVLRIGFGVV